MRIVFLLETLQLAGAERVVLELAKAAPSEDCEATVVVLSETSRLDSGQYGDVQELALFGQGDFEWPRSALLGAWKLRRLLARLRPDLIAIHTPKAAVVAALAGIKVPTLWVLHGHDICWDGVTARRKLSRGLQRWAQRRLRAQMAAVSGSLAQHAAEGLDVPRQEVAVIPNGVETARFQFEERIPRADPVVCVLGRLVAWKGPWQALAAFSFLKKRFPGARLWFVGGGPMREELGAAVAAHGWNKSVVFWGMVERPEEWLRQATVLWMPSESEGLPVACVEAMASGVPVLGFDVRGVRDLLRDGCGVLVPPGDPGQLAAQTVRLVGDPDRYSRIAEAARLRVESQYSVEQMYAGHFGLMRLLCAGKPVVTGAVPTEIGLSACGVHAEEEGKRWSAGIR